jgi:FkbM family methyltransferase
MLKKLLVNLFCSFVPKKRKRQIIRIKFIKNCAKSTKRFKFYGQFTPKTDKFIFERYFNDVNIRGVCIECGANDGISKSNCKFFEDTLGWKCYNIEPSPECFELLDKNRPKSINSRVALSSKEGEIDFAMIRHNHKDGLNGVLDHADKNIRSRKGLENCDFDIIKVPTITYKKFVEDNNIKFVDLFSLDVEGHELEVFKGMENCNVLPSIFYVEDNGDDFELYREILGKMGYVYDVSYFCNYIFIRKDMLNIFNFRKNKNTEKRRFSLS